MNYCLYFTDGSNTISAAQTYTSHNTRRLSKKELKELLQGLDYVQQALTDGGGEGV